MSTIYLQQFIRSRAAGGPAFGRGANEFLASATRRAMARAAHQSVMGMGLRAAQVGAAVVAGEGQGAALLHDVLVDVCRELGLDDTPTTSFVGPVAAFDALFYVRSGIESGWFSHALVFDVVRTRDGVEVFSTLVGTSPGALALGRIALGRADGSPGNIGERLGVAEAKCRWEEGRAPWLHWQDSVQARSPGRGELVGVRAGRAWAAALLERGNAEFEPEAPSQGITLDLHLARAKRCQFPLSLIRLSVDIPTTLGDDKKQLILEADRRLRAVVRAFDEVRRLSDESFLVTLPRADQRASGEVRERLLDALRALDLTGELAIGVEAPSVTVPPNGSVSVQSIKTELGISDAL